MIRRGGRLVFVGRKEDEMPKIRQGPKRLSDLQIRFCEEYIIDCHGTAAAIRAGYKEKSAHNAATNNLHKQAVLDYIDELMAEKKKKSIAQADEVLEYLTAVMRGEQPDEVFNPVTGAHDKLICPNRDRVRAAELLGKRYRLFTERQEITGAVPVVIEGYDEIED